MEQDSKGYGIIYRDYAPYEVLYTRNLTYEEVLRLKGICDMVEIYYNSGQFTNTIRFLEHTYPSPMKLYEDLYTYYIEKKLELQAHSRISRYKIILEFYKEIVLPKQSEGNNQDKEELTRLFEEILLMDLFLREDIKGRPEFLAELPRNKNFRELYEKYKKEYGQFHIEQFSFDIEASVQTGKAAIRPMVILFDYSRRDPISNAAICREINDL